VHNFQTRSHVMHFFLDTESRMEQHLAELKSTSDDALLSEFFETDPKALHSYRRFV